MKTLSIFFISFLCCSFLNAQTTDEVIDRFVMANGGAAKLNAINSIQMESNVQTQMGMSINITTIKEKNKLFRIQTSNPMASEESYTLITDTAGYTFIPAMQGMGSFGGSDAKLEKMDTAYLKQQLYQTDCAGLFASLVDYKAKGNMVELVGQEKVNDVECDKIKLKLKTGQELTYFIAKNNGQVKRINTVIPVAMEMMGMGGMLKMFGGNRDLSTRKIDIDFDKYKMFDGIPFPTAQKFSLGPMEMIFENTSIQVNKPVDSKWYKNK